MALRLRRRSRFARSSTGDRVSIACPERGRLQQPAHLEMLSQPVDRERAGVPSLVYDLFDEFGALSCSAPHGQRSG